MQIAAPCANGASDGPSNHPRYRVCDFDCAVYCWSGFVEWCVSEFVEVKTSELTGKVLDWAVAKAVSHPADWDSPSGLLWFESSSHEWLIWYPSTNWAQGGTLADKYNVDFNTQGIDGDGSQLIEATVQDFESMQCWVAEGETRLEAMCRSIVAAKLGDAVQVPSELVGVE